MYVVFFFFRIFMICMRDEADISCDCSERESLKCRQDTSETESFTTNKSMTRVFRGCCADFGKSRVLYTRRYSN